MVALEPFRRPFFGDPLFPFHIIYRALKHPQHELPDHLHDRYELVYVHRGSGTFFIDKTLYDKKPGDLFLIPGNTVHRAFPEAADPIVSTAVFFAPALMEGGPYDDGRPLLQGFDIARRQGRHRFSVPEDLRRAIESALDTIHEEHESREAGYRAAIRLELGRLLLLLGRYLNQQFADRPADGVHVPSWIRSALHTIDAAPEQPHSLTAFADAAAVSASHFSRTFKQFTGMNVTDYVNAKRIIRAKELLTGTDGTIADIAERCGFASIPHFHRVFKALTDVTPSSYRRGHAAADDAASR
ncbi:AraC-like protein [Paenibacillus methanolicus]|uniref:AraC-like protein n=1 Tax=Paenibacillus methanolicus TaxID=582686 RepID=A0A5S5CEB3_9BACL|nr:AraC-like protein [Paenibacillus methanolicus]